VLPVFAAVLAAAMLAGIALVPRFGFRLALLVAVGLNLVAGLAALLTSRSSPSASSSPLPRTSLLLAALNGIVLFSGPLLWMRGLVFSIGETTSSRALLVVTILGGVAIGAALAAMFMRRRRSALQAFAFVSMAAALAVVVATSFFDEFPAFAGGLTSLSLRLSICAMGVAVPAILLGAATMLLFATGTGRPQPHPNEAGSIAALHLLGGGVGMFAVTFLLIPMLGIRNSLLVMGMISGIAGLFALGSLPELARSRRLTIALGFAALFAITASILPPWDARKLLRASEGGSEEARIVEMREGPAATVFVKKQGNDLELNVNGRASAHSPLDLKTDTLLAELPFLARPDARSVLVSGLGSGVTLSVVAQRRSLESIECLEPIQEVVDAAHWFARRGEADVSKDPRVHMYISNVRSHLLHSPKKYDAIVLRSSPFEGDGFTQEVAQRFREHLAENGVLGMRIREDSLTTNFIPSLLASLLHSFPVVDVWTGEPGDFLVISSPSPMPLSFAAIAQHFQDPAAGNALRTAGIPDPATLLSHFFFDSKAVSQLAVGDPNNMPNLTDVHERVPDLIQLPPEEATRIDQAYLARHLEGEGILGGRDEEAVVLLRQGAAMNPNDLAIRRNLARVCVRVGLQSLHQQKYGAAQSLFNEAIEADPESIDAAGSLAQLSLAGANTEDALKWGQRMLELDPENDFAYAYLGDAYRTQSRWAEARDAYRKALERDPDNVAATLHLAEALTYTGDPEGAVAKIERARRLGAPAEELQRIRKFVRQDG
jgi:predicted membrane-bound spermidine synthase/tetratricopeptide (TPR) repeat protein